MENMDIWNILLTAALALGGFVIKYLFNKVQDIVPEDDIRRIVVDHIAPEQVKQSMIYERLIHIEAKLDKLMEDRQNYGRNPIH